MYLFFFLCLFVSASRGQFEGQSCFQNGVQGVCTNLERCQSAINDIRNRRRQPQICSFDQDVPIVCCLDTLKPVITTTRKPSTTTTTEYVPPPVDYKDNEEVEGGCEILPPTMTAPKTGRKAWDKCIDYQLSLVYPCERGVALLGGMTRKNNCRHSVKDLIIGGVSARQDEFPHMALMGFGDDPQTADWSCGGTIISDRFVLTAGHCTFSRDSGPIAFVLVGTLKRSDQIDNKNLYKIKRIIKHPKYDPPRRYNDIALVETDRTITLSASVVPACLDIGSPNDYQSSLASGWGATENRGASADVLQKVILKKFTTQECSSFFGPNRLMANGFDEKTQICYGDKQKSKDTCQGDSGGPLQLKHQQLECMYTVIGITSFGRACGYIGEPGIYTRVAAYVPWIESIVWP